MIKRICLALLVLCVSFTLCAQSVDEVTSADGNTAVNVAALKGPTAMGLVRLMDRAENSAVNGNDYSFTIVGSPTEITPLLVRGEVDIAALPANLASVIYNNTDGDVEVLAINTLGVLYIVENGDWQA